MFSSLVKIQKKLASNNKNSITIFTINSSRNIDTKLVMRTQLYTLQQKSHTTMFQSVILTMLVLTIMPTMRAANASVVKLPSLHWHSNNRQFKDLSNSGLNYFLKLNAHIGDSIDLICPRGNTANASDYEYSIIYKVSSKYEFDNCIINPNNYDTLPILKCDKPNTANPTKFTIYFVKYSPVPNALEFEEDKEYYFLSTSSGSRDGLNFMSGGMCSKFNMRFSIRIKGNSEVTVNSVLLSKLTKNIDPQDPFNQQHVTLSNEHANKMSTSKLNKIFSSLVNSEKDENIDIEDLGSSSELDHKNQPQVSKLNLVISGASESKVLFSINFSLLVFLIFFIELICARFS